MARFSFNPLKWFRGKGQSAVSSSAASETLLKPPAQPRKSGNIFMHLILLQKTLQSMDLSLRQQIDSTWLVQKAASQVSLLRLEAEAVGEEELAEASGQVLAYFETINEDRLDLDEEGVGVVHDFALIFKDALGDAAPGVRALDEKQIEAWDSRYQSLMARMSPLIEEDAGVTELGGVGPGEETDVEQEVSGPYETADAHEETGVVERAEDGRVDEPVGGTYKPAHARDIEEETPVEYPDAEEFVPISDEEYSAESEEIAALDAAEASSAEMLPFYDPAEEVRARDVVIPDAEVKSARERMELGEPEPEVVERKRRTEETRPEPVRGKRVEAAPGRIDREIPKSPVQLEEVERLKEKLLHLHEKQEMLSSRMSGILGGLKKAVRGEDAGQESQPVEKLDIGELEDLIFIGRKKG